MLDFHSYFILLLTPYELNQTDSIGTIVSGTNLLGARGTCIGRATDEEIANVEKSRVNYELEEIAPASRTAEEKTEMISLGTRRKHVVNTTLP